MGSMTCFSHSEVVEVVGALYVFRGVKERNSHMVPNNEAPHNLDAPQESVSSQTAC